jgi:beta-1,2-mannobiose phosphorylase / 1,2-beta-oligomannan phosphorylase
MAFKLQRFATTPVMLPDVSSRWECYNVFNPSVIYHNGLFHMHYRAQGLDWISRIGYAVSADGADWNRLRKPVLKPEFDYESRGVEDPRVTMIDGTFYMTYTAFGPYRGGQEIAGGSILPMVARSTNLITWERIAPIVRGEDNKDHVLFSSKINGRYLALHRRRPYVWLAYSDNLTDWHERDMARVFGPRKENWWDNTSVGGNGVPIETEFGWLCFYHAYESNGVYRIGVLLLDRDDPGRVLSHPKEPILWPEELWEVKGDVPNVVFSNANILVGDTVYVYYGGADHVIGLATCKLNDILDFARNT